jgi:hypothetical protein
MQGSSLARWCKVVHLRRIHLPHLAATANLGPPHKVSRKTKGKITNSHVPLLYIGSVVLNQLNPSVENYIPDVISCCWCVEHWWVAECVVVTRKTYAYTKKHQWLWHESEWKWVLIVKVVHVCRCRPQERLVSVWEIYNHVYDLWDY